MERHPGTPCMKWNRIIMNVICTKFTNLNACEKGEKYSTLKKTPFVKYPLYVDPTYKINDSKGAPFLQFPCSIFNSFQLYHVNQNIPYTMCKVAAWIPVYLHAKFHLSDWRMTCLRTLTISHDVCCIGGGGGENPLYKTWHDSAWMPVLNQTNIMDYFAERSNTFYDRTCNNEVVKMQRLHPDQLMWVKRRQDYDVFCQISYNDIIICLK